MALAEPEARLADKGYDADHFVERLKVRAIKPVIPPKSNRKIKRVDDHMDFGCEPAVRAADGLVATPFLRAPALC